MAIAEREGDRIVVTTQWNERELIKMVPGARWSATEKRWSAPLTWATANILRGVFADALTLGPELQEWGWEERLRVDGLMRLRGMTEPDWEREPQHADLYPFQEVGRAFALAGGCVIIADEMGTGKTIQALAALDDALPAIVICPNSVKRNWELETRRWCPAATPYVVVGGAVGRKKIIETALADPTALVIVNIEALRTMSRVAPYGSIRLKRCRQCDRYGEETVTEARCQVHPRPLNRIPFRTVIIDEAHRIKDPTSQQTRATWAVCHQDTVTQRWALTGTPLANHPGDLWPVLHAVAPVEFPTKGHFVDRYCLQSWNPHGGLDIVGLNPAHRDEFYHILDPHFRRMPKDLVLTQLPPKVRSVRYVEMTNAQARAYRELDNGLATMTSGGVLVARNGLVARTRLMQLASSMVNVMNVSDPDNLDDWVVTLTEPSPKLDELEAVIEENGGKQLVICAEQRQLIELAAARLEKRGESFGLITGKIGEYERHTTLSEFQAGRVRYLLFTIKAGGVGLTMTAADTIVFLQRSWSMVDNRQAEDRVHRIGSERHESVHIIDIVTRDTVEEDQITRLFEKLMRLEEITRDRQTLRDAGRSTADLDDEENRILNSELV